MIWTVKTKFLIDDENPRIQYHCSRDGEIWLIEQRGDGIFSKLDRSQEGRSKDMVAKEGESHDLSKE